jgi:hypothetical protein
VFGRGIHIYLWYYGMLGVTVKNQENISQQTGAYPEFEPHAVE